MGKAWIGGTAAIAIPLLVSAVMPIALPANRLDATEVRIQASHGNDRMTPTSRPGVSGTLTGMTSSVAGAIAEADVPVGFAARTLALGAAAMLQVPRTLPPTVIDNELGGIVMYWRGKLREIQIEIDADGSHFVRVRDAAGATTFENEGFGEVPTREVSAALAEWAAERTSKPQTRA